MKIISRTIDISVSIIIPVYNAEDTIQKCLIGIAEGIKNTTYTPATEVILVDNGSSDNSFAICKNFQQSNPHIKVMIVEEAARGPSAARNTGAMLAKGTWLFFTDADCIPSRNWISDYAKHFADEEIGAIAGSIWPYLPTEANLTQKSISLFTLPPITEEIVHSGFNLREGFYPTANIAVRKETFNLIGGFNENLIYGEDHELCYKIYKAGFKIKAITTALVKHIHRSTLKGLIKQAFGFGSAHPFELKHFTFGATILEFPFFHINRATPGRWIWIDFNQADKKMLFCIILGLIWPPLYPLAAIYFCYLCLFIMKISKQRGVSIRTWELPCLSVLLIIKSLALTAGRTIFSFKHKVICM